VANALSVYGGARLAGMRPSGARNLAVALNARGGPAIVLASVAFDARIINERFYVALVMLALVTSALAGSWLDFTLRSGRGADDILSDAEGPVPAPAPAGP
jgi:Kef-type K+ transport system membrane component KefB